MQRNVLCRFREFALFYSDTVEAGILCNRNSGLRLCDGFRRQARSDNFDAFQNMQREWTTRRIWHDWSDAFPTLTCICLPLAISPIRWCTWPEVLKRDGWIGSVCACGPGDIQFMLSGEWGVNKKPLVDLVLILLLGVVWCLRTWDNIVWFCLSKSTANKQLGLCEPWCS